MQFLQYLAVLTQYLPGLENITAPLAPLAPTTTNLELHTTIIPLNPQLVTQAAIYTMTDQQKRFTLPPLPYAYDVSRASGGRGEK